MSHFLLAFTDPARPGQPQASSALLTLASGDGQCHGHTHSLMGCAGLSCVSVQMRTVGKQVVSSENLLG